MNVTTTPWLAVSKPNPRASLRLFCFHYAGGGPLVFRRWPEGLPSFVEVCPVQLPGRGSRLREPHFTRLGPLVEAADENLRPYFDKPFAFFGHSMGAMISFELARLLRAERRPGPLHLFVSGRRAPQLPDTDPPTYDLPETEFVEELRRLNGTPAEVLAHPELMQLVLPTLRADFAVCQTYDYSDEPPLDCPISAFGGLQDKDVGREKMERWGVQTTADFKLRMLPGDHFFLNTATDLLLQTLARDLAQIAGAAA